MSTHEEIDMLRDAHATIPEEMSIKRLMQVVRWWREEHYQQALKHQKAINDLEVKLSESRSERNILKNRTGMVCNQCGASSTCQNCKMWPPTPPGKLHR